MVKPMTIKSTSSCPEEVYSIVDGKRTRLLDHGRPIRELDKIAWARTVCASAQGVVSTEGVFIPHLSKSTKKLSSGGRLL